MNNEEIGKFNYIIKNYPKDIIVTAHHEWIETDEGAVEKRIATKGKEWKGMIEKDYTIVVYADMKMKDNKRTYIIKLQTDGKDSAKTPPMFIEDDQLEIENDSNAFLERIRKVLSNNK